MSPKSIAIVAGEASGDQHAAHVIQTLRARHPDAFFCGMGGHAMRAAGAKVIIDANELAVVGITEVIGKIPRLFKAVTRIKQLLKSLRPDLLILIDFPDFNLHVAATAKKLGIPVLYYISPQIWAWRSSRVKKIKKRIDHMAVILPFETEFYTRSHVPVTFVGHPLMDCIHDAPRTNSPAQDNAIPRIGFLPGSRDGEVSRLLPIMLQAAHLLTQKMPSAQFLVSSAPSLDDHLVESIVAQHPLPNLEIVRQPVERLFERSRLIVTASGTASLQAAIWGIPMIVTYVVSPLSYALGRLLIKVPYIGMANLIAQQRIVPELVQNEMTAQSVAAEACRLLADSDAYMKMCRDLSVVRERLGKPGASARVADIACSLMECTDAV
jgi:lipid-A-disaccharide synthase